MLRGVDCPVKQVNCDPGGELHSEDLMSKLLATLIVCIATLAVGGCADGAKEPRQSTSTGSTGQDTQGSTKLENCVTAVGADRKNCAAK